MRKEGSGEDIRKVGEKGHKYKEKGRWKNEAIMHHLEKVRKQDRVLVNWTILGAPHMSDYHT